MPYYNVFMHKSAETAKNKDVKVVKGGARVHHGDDLEKAREQGVENATTHGKAYGNWYAIVDQDDKVVETGNPNS